MERQAASTNPYRNSGRKYVFTIDANNATPYNNNGKYNFDPIPANVITYTPVVM
jgi:hypothetical protein